MSISERAGGMNKFSNTLQGVPYNR